MAKEKKKGNGILMGPILIVFSVLALWKNEHRFDYYKAAEATTPVKELTALQPEDLFSHTGSMDQDLTLRGQFIRSFKGYLKVKRNAEIYAWNRKEDDDGVSWSKEWMSYLQENERNDGLTKKFTGKSFSPPTFQIGPLEIQPEKIQFIDKNQSISTQTIELSKRGLEQKFEVEDDRFFYFEKGGTEQLGDERISYQGLPIPEIATYFGKWSGENAVFHQAEIKEGFISGIIGDNGTLHHLISGDRESALRSLKSHIKKRKMITRGVALTTCSIGGGILFSTLTRFLIFLPGIGPLISRLTGWIGLVVGFVIGFLTIIFAYLTSHPLILAFFLIVLVSTFVLLSKNATKKKKIIRQKLQHELGYAPSPLQLRELEFCELFKLAEHDGVITDSEQTQLDQWARKHNLKEERVAELTLDVLNRPSPTSPQESLRKLISFSLADGKIDKKEIKTLQQAAAKIGKNKQQLNLLISQAQQ